MFAGEMSKPSQKEMRQKDVLLIQHVLVFFFSPLKACLAVQVYVSSWCSRASWLHTVTLVPLAFSATARRPAGFTIEFW